MSRPTDPPVLEWLGEDDYRLEWLSTSDYREKQAQYISQALEGTGHWFLDSAELEKWLSESDQVMCCPGKSGAGKTVMTAMVVEALEKRFRRDSTVGIAYFYLSRHGRDNPSSAVLFASLLQQLAKQQLHTIPDALGRLFEGSVLSDQSQLPAHDLLGALAAVAGLFSRLFILIDGLDALESPSGAIIAEDLFNCQKDCKFNLFATSRSSPAIDRYFENAIVLEIGASVEDIGKLVDEHLSWQLKEAIRNQPELQGKIKDWIAHQAEGTFVLPKHQVDQLNSKRTAGEVKRVVESDNSLTEDLRREIQHEIDRIKNQDQKSSQVAQLVLAWICYSKRPLHGNELRHAIVVESRASDLDFDGLSNLSDGKLLSLCGSLVVVESGFYGLRHDVAREHLKQAQKDFFSNAETTLARVCLTYLSFDDFATGRCPTDNDYELRKQKYTLLNYASRHWGHHFQLADSNTDPEGIAFLSNKNLLASVSQAVSAEPRATGPGYSQRFNQGTTGLHLAAHFDLLRIIPSSMSSDGKPSPRIPFSFSDGDPAPKDWNGHTPLWLAVIQGNTELIRQLSKLDKTTFRLMVQKKEKSLVEILIRVANKHIKDFRKRNPLHIAVKENDLSMMRDAVRWGVGLDEKDNDGATPLYLAIRQERTPMIEFLLEKSADTVGVKSDDWRQAYNKDEDAIVQMIETASTGKVIRFSAGLGHTFKWDRETTISVRRLMMSRTGVPYSKEDFLYKLPLMVSHTLFSVTEVYDEGQINRHSIVASVPNEIQSGKTVYRWPTNVIQIAWTMTFPKNATGKEDWISRDHFSTLTHGSMPDTGAAFAIQFIEDLRHQWMLLCLDAEEYLDGSHAIVLEKEGLDHTLIRRLLRDARSWTDLRGILRQHVQGVRGFQVQYAIKDYNDEYLDKLTESIDAFANDIQQKLSDLDQTSQNQIQIQFNLTSIAEAQKSTSTNRSMKRLTWITFIFLPLTFISGLLGMNVDILESNPPWWWYVVLASTILILTLSVWITFKITNLEAILENTFARLVERKKVHDHID